MKEEQQKEADESEVKTIVEALVEPAEAVVVEKHKEDIVRWKPRTSIGLKVKNFEIKNIDGILDQGLKILEPQITDALLPNLKTELLFIGQSKGKFGGGARRIFRQTQKKSQEGNKPSFACFAVVGDNDGHLGAGSGKTKDTVPAREKAIRKAKLNIFKIRRGCGSWECSCREPHSIPFEVAGKSGSVGIRLLPAPKGKGLCIEKECAKILSIAGIKDVWSKTSGKTNTKLNLVKACIAALQNLMKIKINSKIAEKSGIVEGSIKKTEVSA